MKYTANIKINPNLKLFSQQNKKKSIINSIFNKVLNRYKYEDYSFERDQFVNLVGKLEVIYYKIGISNLIRISGDNIDYYIDTENNKNDFKQKINDFKSDFLYSHSKLKNKLVFVLQKNTDDLEYVVENIIDRKAKKYPVIIKLTVITKKQSITDYTEEFKLFIFKLEHEIRKFIDSADIVIETSSNYISETTETPAVNYTDNYSDENKTENIEQIPKRQGYSNEFFPLHGITLGVTPVSVIKKMGVRSKYKDDKGDFFKSYNVRNINFWYDKGIAESMYITRTEAMPEKWEKVGFSWENSYDECLEILKKLDFFISVIKKPRRVWYDGHFSFSASFSAVKKVNDYFQLVMEFGFNYGRGRNTKAKNTLYKISIRMK